MSANDLTSSVYQIVAEFAQTPSEDIKGSDRLREDLGLDSLQSMELLSRVSEEFEIDPDLEAVMAVSTVDEVVTSLADHLPG